MNANTVINFRNFRIRSVKVSDSVYFMQQEIRNEKRNILKSIDSELFCFMFRGFLKIRNEGE